MNNKWFSTSNLNIDSLCKGLIKEKQHNVNSDLLYGKLAIITGGHGSIGLACAKEMLRHSLLSVTIADINTCKGELAVEELCKEFGPKKASFVKCDVTNPQLFDCKTN